MLMRKHKAHGCTDVTGFGILGHAENLAKAQKREVMMVIDKLPVIAGMANLCEPLNHMFGLLKGRSAETSGEI